MKQLIETTFPCQTGNCIETKQPTAFTNCNKEINKQLPIAFQVALAYNQSDALFLETTQLGDAINIRFNALKDETYIVHVIDNSGNEVIRQYRFLPEGDNALEIKTQNLTDGTYHIKIDNEFQSVLGKLAIKK